MKLNSILFGLDGTTQSRYAAELMFKLSDIAGAKLDAQHVVNSVGLWEFLGFDTPGFTGSGPYVNAQQKILADLRSLGDTLINVYQSHAASHSFAGEAFLDEGNPLEEICRRAKNYDLVAIGHKPTGVYAQSRERALKQPSLGESLAQHCERPLLLVQDKLERISSLSAVLPSDMVFPNTLAAVLALAKTLAVPLRICFWTRTGDRQHNLESVIKAYNDAFPEFTNAAIERLYDESTRVLPNIDLPPNSLVVVPTRHYGKGRETGFADPPELAVRYCQAPALLVYPEEFGESKESQGLAQNISFRK